ncbi:MAG: hydantoinase B/oxoprolinase family protein [Candidatus Thorarchaeota archaeon]|nr:MAG: hydantoinase B/oxoprolinase family protein [Candidatus Thorarchaeota archaeon]
MIEDPIAFEVIKNMLISISREMSHSLMRSAFSPNIKERRDHSCAVFDATGQLVAQSEDIPVHLGAMPLSVKSCISNLGKDLEEGSMALHNDPFTGGSHLPDLTLVAPVCIKDERVAFVANRAHHADVGGVSPGSMPGMSTTIFEEGVLISPRIIVKTGTLIPETVEDLLTKTRTPDERLGDLSAQIAANNVGIRRVHEAASKLGLSNILRTMVDLRAYSMERMKRVLKQHEGRSAEFTDYMDSDGAGTEDIPIKTQLVFKNSGVQVSFEGTADQVAGNVNCPMASTLSSVYFVFLSQFGSGIPINEGCWTCIEVDVPEGSMLNPRFPAAVSAGNVETSQRIVDVILGALAQVMPDDTVAASQGTMNNLTVGGRDPERDSLFSFYETIGGGTGAFRGMEGTSSIHSHMTNTLNTPIESLESEYPMRVVRYGIREGSGGRGKWNGGQGVVREIEILAEDCTVSIQSERRSRGPWGLQGGLEGAPGQNTLVVEGIESKLPAKFTRQVPRGAVIRIETPGGGGWGTDSEA